jgi:hypothetical protein
MLETSRNVSDEMAQPETLLMEIRDVLLVVSRNQEVVIDNLEQITRMLRQFKSEVNVDQPEEET